VKVSSLCARFDPLDPTAKNCPGTSQAAVSRGCAAQRRTDLGHGTVFIQRFDLSIFAASSKNLNFKANRMQPSPFKLIFAMRNMT
jgi:hypothetical protein